MLSLILTVIAGTLFAVIATQNTQAVNLRLFNYSFVDIPLYLVLLASLLAGLIVAGFISALDSLGAFFSLRRKESTINSAQAEIDSIHNKIHDLEVENARLKGEHTEPVIEERREPEEVQKPRYSFLDRLRHSF